MVCALVHGIHRCDSKHWTSACCSVFRSCISRSVSQRRAEVGSRHSALVTALKPPPTCYTPPSPAQSDDSSVDLRHRLGGQTKRTCAWSNDRDTPHSHTHTYLRYLRIPSSGTNPCAPHRALFRPKHVVQSHTCSHCVRTSRALGPARHSSKAAGFVRFFVRRRNL